MIDKIYDKHFFKSQCDGSYNSAKELVPMILSLVKAKRVVDIGCGVGTWLKAFSEAGVKEIFGIDAGAVDDNNLVIPKDYFQKKDLRGDFSAGMKKFDLAISLEVAEHLPNKCSRSFIKNLTALSDVIVFSAAIPWQWGERHINEQLPIYWKKLFREEGYYFFDPFRFKIIDNKNIEWWYRQNIFLVVSERRLASGPLKDLPKYNEEFVLVYQKILQKYDIFIRIRNFFTRLLKK